MFHQLAILGGWWISDPTFDLVCQDLFFYFLLLLNLDCGVKWWCAHSASVTVTLPTPGTLLSIVTSETPSQFQSRIIDKPPYNHEPFTDFSVVTSGGALPVSCCLLLSLQRRQVAALEHLAVSRVRLLAPVGLCRFSCVLSLRQVTSIIRTGWCVLQRCDGRDLLTHGCQ